MYCSFFEVVACGPELCNPVCHAPHPRGKAGGTTLHMCLRGLFFLRKRCIYANGFQLDAWPDQHCWNRRNANERKLRPNALHPTASRMQTSWNVCTQTVRESGCSLCKQRRVWRKTTQNSSGVCRSPSQAGSHGEVLVQANSATNKLGMDSVFLYEHSCLVDQILPLGRQRMRKGAAALQRQKRSLVRWGCSWLRKELYDICLIRKHGQGIDGMTSVLISTQHMQCQVDFCGSPFLPCTRKHSEIRSIPLQVFFGFFLLPPPRHRD